MRNLKIFTIGLIALFTCLVPVSFAATAEKGDFVVIGMAENGVRIDKMVALMDQPVEYGAIHSEVKSGTTALVADKAYIGGENFYLVSTVGRDGGFMGWVTEEYIYEITEAPIEE